MPMPRVRSSLIRALICAGALAAVASCPGSKTNDRPTTPEKTTPMPKPVESLKIVDTDQKGLLFKLTEGVEGAEGNKGTPPAKTTPLSEAETKQVLDRLPPVQV